MPRIGMKKHPSGHRVVQDADLLALDEADHPVLTVTMVVVTEVEVVVEVIEGGEDEVALMMEEDEAVMMNLLV